MENERLTDTLCKKMSAELEQFRDRLLKQYPEEILNHTYEFTVKQDILLAMENNRLSDGQAAALLKSASPLEDIFRSYEKRETGHMDDIQDTITDRADTLLSREKELRDTPLYPASAVYAQEHGELDQYFASARANTACRDAIDQAISANHDGYRLNAEPAVRQVVVAFGYDRALYVLANTIQHKEQDGRFSASNKQWAASQHIVPDIDSFGHDRTLEFVVDRAHPGVVDLFTTFLRREYLLTQPLTAEDITAEAKRICERLQAEPEPNSPNKTHFMAKVSPDFLARASTKDMETFQRCFPFKSLTLTTMKDTKGVFSVIARDEDRNRQLRQPRASVMKKLKEPVEAPKPNKPRKAREAELE